MGSRRGRSSICSQTARQPKELARRAYSRSGEGDQCQVLLLLTTVEVDLDRVRESDPFIGARLDLVFPLECVSVFPPVEQHS
jgi:hypothetical protein